MEYSILVRIKITKEVEKILNSPSNNDGRKGLKGRKRLQNSHPSSVGRNPSGDRSNGEVPEIGKLCPGPACSHVGRWPQKSCEDLDEVVAEVEDLPDRLPGEPDHHVSELVGEELHDLLGVGVRVDKVDKLLLQLFLVRARDFVSEDFEFVCDDLGVVLPAPFRVAGYDRSRHLRREGLGEKGVGGGVGRCGYKREKGG